jgi:hypothetical protein
MKRTLLTAACLAACLANPGPAQADDNGPLSIAVIGDWPYSQALLDNAHKLVNGINDDKGVKLVMHVGDIHSGSMPCTSAHIGFDYQTKTGSPIATSNPGWNQAIYYQFQQFERPVVYTPGDNEWADCHKAKQFSSGAPLKELASVREMFFARPGVTLGQRAKRVTSQADAYDPAHPEDSQFVENVMWDDARVVFATFNMPGGSNNDADPWTGNFANGAAQAEEAATRTAADLRWLDATFARAKQGRARAVVIGLQADMWDLEGGAAHLTNYTSFVQKLADLALQFGRPVLLINGDSHVYKSDQPLADPTSTLGQIHKTRAVPNFTRIVVEGSGVGTHWLRLSINPSDPAVFSWSNVAY